MSLFILLSNFICIVLDWLSELFIASVNPLISYYFAERLALKTYSEILGCFSASGLRRESETVAILFLMNMSMSSILSRLPAR